MRRAVAHAVGRADPAPGSGGAVISGELAGDADDEDIADHQRRARESPLGLFMPVSDAALCDHTTAPSRALSTFRIPVAPNVYTRPLLRVGVARGPAPPFDSQKRDVSRCAHTGSPLVSL